MKGGAGRSSFALYGIYDRSSCSWKIRQRSLLSMMGEPSAESLESWPKQASMRIGRVYAPRTLERLTVETDSSCSPTGQKPWPTPDASISNDGENEQQWMERKLKHASKDDSATRAGVPLAIAVKLWPTPVTTDAASAARHTTTTGVMHPGTTLTDAVRIHWATPTARDEKGPSQRRDRAKAGADLPGQVEPGNPNAKLNPDWVECLMGFPIGWTRLDGQPRASSTPKGTRSRARSTTGNRLEPSTSPSAVEGTVDRG